METIYAHPWLTTIWLAMICFTVIAACEQFQPNCNDSDDPDDLTK